MAQNRAENLPPLFDLRTVVANFSIQGTFSNGRPFGSGHIHDTFLIQTGEKDCPDYILQRINQGIFLDVLQLMENIVRVTKHLRAKLSTMPGSNLEREVLTVVPAVDGRSFHQDEKGNYWRCYLFIDHHRSFDHVPNPELAFEAGKHFGRFLNLLADLPAPPLHETIAGFHNLEIHLQRFFGNLQADACNRAGTVATEIDFIRSRADEMKRFQRLVQAGLLPLRVTHNDTKVDNVLFDRQGRGLCIIDLDTVMPGYVHYDFGDAVRSGCNLAREDESDLDQVNFDLALFKGYAKGFLFSLCGCLSGEETAHLAFSAKQFAFLVGLRFLSDYLAGDRYFRITHPSQNLQRSRVQFRLLQSMEGQFAEMEDIISSLSAKARA
ncbi:MAG: aminoglycoside phosphotransferase family protein [Candidatus Aminicenantes bacterium]|nr:aminoglycoside phosphotransferase family protein [Candidatus Aminicenantes bacterium]